MKPQDILFIIILAILIFKRSYKWLATSGLICLIISIPLFYKKIFFTAERLVDYAALLLFLAIMLLLFKQPPPKKII